jgi:hypothetical protein
MKGLARPAYTWGPKDRQIKTGTFMFQCPVSAIPEAVVDLLLVWWQCRMMHLPPPVMTPLVQLAWVTFESEMLTFEGQRNGQQAEMAAALAVGGMVRALRGG